MADYEHSMHSRNYPPNHLKTGESGPGLFWALFAIAVLGVLVLIGGFGGGATPISHPGGAGAEPVTLQPELAPLPDASTAIVE